MADIAGVRDFQGIAAGGANEAKGMAADIHIAQRLGNSRHMTGDTLAARAVRKMMGVGSNRGSVWAVR